MDRLKIELSQGNVNQGHFYIPRGFKVFPESVWGGGKKSEAGEQVKIFFEGINESVKTDIDGKKRLLRNARGESRKFIQKYELSKGDFLYIKKKSDSEFVVSVHAGESADKEIEKSTIVNTPRTDLNISRLIRDTAVSKKVKSIHKNKCQVCGESIRTKSGWYSEGAHIQGLGEPHNGPDIIENILCLCPNHHAMFDKGGFSINDDFSLNGLDGYLKISPEHPVSIEYIKYHRINA